MNNTNFKSAAFWLVGGMISLPVLVIVFSYAFGVAFRPTDINLGQAFMLINESIFSASTHSDSFIGNLPIWLAAGGILGLVAYAVRSFLRGRSTVQKKNSEQAAP
jgi:hypothetical protein